MLKLGNTRRTIAMAAATLALAGGMTVTAASSASATVTKNSVCSPTDYSLKIRIGASWQCFNWDGESGNYLNVNDWYDAVYAGSYYVEVTWHDVKTGEQFGPYLIDPGQESDQPTFNSVLTGVTFVA
ncbi:hypothetical protein [Kitasatospora viridis]|uniref:Beta/gamma crystallin n=1 Tax=Kitasatospora viridis TaxID=281105 RepID=A0A561UMJ4_9ACTN|nr:hypothetical protein [Kitasatospora viridis]TWG00598.1 hypothetical protein FHX73_114478 [Kitasatospora viridis]